MEFALILPVLVLLIFGITDFAMAVFSYNTIANAAREGARYGVVFPDDTAGITAAAQSLTTGLNGAALDISVTQPDDETIRVDITYDHTLLTGPVVQAVGGDPVLRMRTAATMQIE